MSHLVSMELEVKDLDALREAADELGLALRENKTFQWWGRFQYDSRPGGALEGMDPKEFGKCDMELCWKHGHAPQAPDLNSYPNWPWTIGIIRKGDKLHFVWDDYSEAGAAIRRVIGKDAQILKQLYATRVVEREAIRKGFWVQRVTEKTPTAVRLTAGIAQPVPEGTIKLVIRK